MSLFRCCQLHGRQVRDTTRLHQATADEVHLLWVDSQASSAQEAQPKLAASKAFMEHTQAEGQQHAAQGMPGGFYAAPHTAYCMPAQMPAPGPAAFGSQSGPASMTGMPAGGMMATGAAGLLPMPAPNFASGSQAPGPHAMGPTSIRCPQPRSPAFQQHSAPGGTVVSLMGVCTCGAGRCCPVALPSSLQPRSRSSIVFQCCFAGHDATRRRQAQQRQLRRAGRPQRAWWQHQGARRIQPAGNPAL